MQGLASALGSEDGALRSLLALPQCAAALPPGALEPALPQVRNGHLHVHLATWHALPQMQPMHWFYLSHQFRHLKKG
jgi:hypothetical protein